jgi:hypothetical protein
LPLQMHLVFEERYGYWGKASAHVVSSPASQLTPVSCDPLAWHCIAPLYHPYLQPLMELHLSSLRSLPTHVRPHSPFCGSFCSPIHWHFLLFRQV